MSSAGSDDAARAREEAQVQHRRIIELSPEAIAIHRQGVLLYVNPAGAALVGAATPQELIGRSIFEFVHPDYRAAVAQRVQQVQGSGEATRLLEERFMRLDGTPIDVEVVAIPVTYDGAPASQVIIRDVTERRRAEAALRESRDQLDVILRGVADGITAQTPDGRLAYANDAAARILGYEDAPSLIGAPVKDVMRRFQVLNEQGEVIPVEQLPQRRALAGERPAPAALRFRILATGEERWSLLTSSPVFDDAGAVRFAISIFRDVTERRRAEERLRFLADAGRSLPSSLDVKATLQQVAQTAVATLADWSVVYLVTAPPTDSGARPAVEEVAAGHRDPAKLPLAEEMHRRYPAEQSREGLLWRVLETGTAALIPDVPEDLLVRSARDPEHLALMRALQVRSAIWVPLLARGRTLGVLGLFVSDAGRRYTTDDLALAEEIARRAALAVDNARLYQEAQDALRARDEFLSIAAHELRTPVTAIKGTAELLLRSRSRGTLDDERLEQALYAFDTGSDRLAALIDDLLDVARLQSGRMVLRVRPIDLSAFVREVVEWYRMELTEHHTLDLDLQPVGAVTLDPDRIEQVVTNLLTNAEKYSPDGGPIAVRLQSTDDGVTLSVADRGIGLPVGEEEHIFEPFGRASNAAERRIQGMGLGLHISREIVVRHGGRIWVQSAGPGKGTTFFVWLPRSNPAASGPTA